MKNIGFIGTGVMGGAMAAHLIENGCRLSVYSRTKAKAEAIIDKGAVWAGSVAECVNGKDAVITMVGFPKDVEEVYFGQDGIIENAQKGAYLIDMTTTSPKLSEKIYAAAKKKGLHAVDAPVSGGDTGAKNATLSIMAGGDRPAFDAVEPLFKMMGKSVIYEGAAGSGQHTKMANQIAIAGAVSGVCEAIAYAHAVGLDTDRLLSSIGGGAAGSWQLSNVAPKMIAGDFAPGFYIKHYIKDMKIADEEAMDRGLTLNVLNDALDMYETLERQGLSELGTQALIKYYEL